MTSPLHALARSHGIATQYHTAAGVEVTVPDSTLEAVLVASGVPADDIGSPERASRRRSSEAADEVLPRTLVVRGDVGHIDLRGIRAEDVRNFSLADEAGRPVAATLERSDSGARLALTIALQPDYYRLSIKLKAGEHSAAVIAAPSRCPDVPPEAGRLWGWTVQLYGMRSEMSWGIGDLSDLGRFATRTAEAHGADFVLLNPLHAPNPTYPQQPSPYYPSSRMYRSPLYLAVEDIPEARAASGDLHAAIAQAASAGRALNRASRVNRDLAYRQKSAAVETLFQPPRLPERAAAFAAYKQREGRPLLDFATYCALAEEHGVPFQQWPERLRHPSNAAVEAARTVLHDRVEYHSWVQWLIDEQLADAQHGALRGGMRLGLIQDLAVGADAGGADAWALQDVLAPGVVVGAPPDSFNPNGQSWGVPPWAPHALEASDFAAYKALLRSAFTHAGGVRIDHALGLFRLFWVPDGCSPAEGTYVRYPAEVLMAIIAVEAWRAGAIVIAEDLGTVQAGVRERLDEWGLLRSAVLWFERGEGNKGFRRPAEYPRHVFASATTHDLQTPAGFWTGDTLRSQTELGLIGGDRLEVERDAQAGQRREMLELLEAEGLADARDPVSTLVPAMEALVARTPAVLVGVGLADALGEVWQPNLPGTVDEYPNWVQPLRKRDEHGALAPVLLDDVFGDAGLERVVEAVRAERSAG